MIIPLYVFYTAVIIAICLSIIAIMLWFVEKKKINNNNEKNNSEHGIILKQLDRIQSIIYNISTRFEITEEQFKGLERTLSNIQSKFTNSLEDFADGLLIDLLEKSVNSELSNYLVHKKIYLVDKCKNLIKKGIDNPVINNDFLDMLFSDYRNENDFSDNVDFKLFLEHFKITVLSIKEFGNGGSNYVLIEKCKEFIKKVLDNDFYNYQRYIIKNSIKERNSNNHELINRLINDYEKKLILEDDPKKREYIQSEINRLKSSEL